MSQQQALVVGLGQFGMALSRALTALGTEVIAVDRRPEKVQAAAEFAAEAVSIDAMDEDDLASLRPGSRDLCVCAIGEESREASIVVTALMRQMGARRLVARATDDLHERILKLVGATEVLNPERVLGERLAARLSYPGVIDVLPLGEDLVITEVHAPKTSFGRTLAELALPRRFSLTVLAVRHADDRRVTIPRADLALEPNDVIVVVGPPGAAQRLVEAG